jgi:hypothetical protein
MPRSAVVLALPLVLLGSGRALAAVDRGAVDGGALFVENRGQAGPDALLYADGDGARVSFTEHGVEWLVDPPGGTATRAPESRTAPVGWRGVRARPQAGGRLAAAEFAPLGPQRREVLELVGTASRLVPVGRGRTQTRVSYFRGRPEDWRVDLATYREVVYPSAWPGVDLVFALDGGRVVARAEGAPGARRDLARLRWRGGPEIEIAWSDERPSAAPPGSASVAPSAALAAVTFAGFIGGAEDERGLGVTIGPDGGVYVTGEGPSADRGSQDAFVAKIDETGTSLEFVAFVGGAQYDAGFDVAVADDGSALVVGMTQSNQSTFPVRAGPDLTYNDNGDVLIAKLAPDGADLEWAGYFGGDGLDFAEGVAIAGDGGAVLTGVTGSLEHSFPLAVGPDLTFNGEPTEDDPDLDAFVARLVPQPVRNQVARNIVYSGYIGGLENDAGVFPEPGGDAVLVTSGQVALGPDDAAYVSGMTESPQSSFPGGSGFRQLPGPDRTHNGGWDGWVAKVEPDGSALAYAGYVGGTGADRAFGMAVDGDGAAYVTGDTDSPEGSLKPVGGPDLTYGGKGDALLAKVAPDGSAFDFLGYLGGDDVDAGRGVALGPDGTLLTVGYTESTADTFPVVGGPDTTHNDTVPNAGDAYLCRLRVGARQPEPAEYYEYCGYIGGADFDQAFWVAAAADGAAIVVGDTESDETTFPNGSGMSGMPSFDAVAGGKSDAFVARVSASGQPATAQPTASSSATATTPASATVGPTATVTAPPPATTTAPPTPEASATSTGPTGAALFLPLAYAR